MVIRHNLNGMRIINMTSRRENKIQKNLEKLSSGYRVNRAADDASGLSVSEKLRVQITETDRAQLNAGEAVNLVQTTDGALQEVHELLRRMKYLAGEASNGTYEGTDRYALEAELDQCVGEIDRIAQGTRFNHIPVLRTSKEGGAEPVEPEPVWPDPINAQPTCPVPEAPAPKSPPTVQQAPISGNDFSVTASGVYEIANNFTGTITILPGLEVKLVRAPSSAALKDVSIQCGEDVDLFMENVSLTLGTNKGKNLPAISFTGKNNTLTLSGENTIINQATSPQKAMVEVNYGAGLVIGEEAGKRGTLNLKYNKASHSAAIGGSMDFSAGDITIAGGTINAICNAKCNAAIIGSGGKKRAPFDPQPGGNLHLLGGSINLVAKQAASALIGSGTGGIGIGVITVAGANITAHGAPDPTDPVEGNGAIIGAGSPSACEEIRILKGNIHVLGGEDLTPIGGGDTGTVGRILIEGDGSTRVYAETVNTGYPTTGPAIGGSSVGEIIIRGGTVEAITGEGSLGAAIGSGYGENGTSFTPVKIRVEGGDITATSGKDALGAVLGEGANTGGTDILISGGKLNLTAGEDAQGAAIGGGGANSQAQVQQGATVGISGGQVTVASGTIGSGLDDAGDLIAPATTTITGGVLKLDDPDGSLPDGVNGEDTRRVFVSGAPPKWPLKPNEEVTVTINGVEQTGKADMDGNLTLFLPYDDAPDAGPLDIEIKTASSIFQGSILVEDNHDGTMQIEFTRDAVPDNAPGPGVIVFHFGSGDSNFMVFRIQDMTAESLGIDRVSVGSVVQANDTVDKVGEAISKVSSYRGYCGAVQNRLEHTRQALSVTHQNVSDAESGIRDMDVAQGMSEMVKDDILLQSAMAMLSQANQSPEKVLALIQA